MVKNILVVMLQDKNKAETKGPIRIGAYCPCLIIWGPEIQFRFCFRTILAYDYGIQYNYYKGGGLIEE
jgi:hypothetical protein